MKERFVFLDRDGTLIEEKNYLSDPEGVKLLPGAVDALSEFQRMGLGLVVVTNQAGLGRGYFDLPTLAKIHDRLTEILARKGIVLDDILFCPHTPEDNCMCRKPKPGLIEEAMKKHKFDPKLCFVIGDKAADIELGKNIGATTILVKTGYGVETEREGKVTPDFVVDNLMGSLDIIKKEIG